MNGPTELHGTRHILNQGTAMPDQSLPAGVPELSGDEAIDMSRHLDPVSAAYNLGARRGYEAGLEAAEKVCEPHLFIYRKLPGDYIEGQNRGIEKCLDAIRQLKGKT